MSEIHEKVKNAIDLAVFIKSRTSQELVRAGQSLSLSECPFCGHKECFRIDEGKQLFKCFSAGCGKGGDVYSFLEAQGLSKADALKDAAAYASIELPTSTEKPKAPSTRQKILLAAATYYQKALWQKGRASYLREERGRSQAILEEMGVGYADGALHGYLTKLGFKKEEILKSGMAKENRSGGLYDFFPSGLFIYPHYLRGEVTHFTQKDPNPDKEARKEHQLPASCRSKYWRFYNQDALAKYKVVILVEGENDVQAWMEGGYRNVIGSIGQISLEQIKTLLNFCKDKHLYLCLDNDKAGHGYVRRIVKAMEGPEYHIKVIPIDEKSYEDGGVKDIDDLLRKCVKDGKPTEAKRVFGAAISPLAWEILQVKGLTSLEEKLSALKGNDVFARVAELVEVEKEVMIEKLEALGFSKKAVEQQLETNNSLLDKVKGYFGEKENRKDADPNQLAGLIFEGFANKGRWFYDSQDNCYLFWRHKIYKAGSNRPFNALIKRHTMLLPTREPGRSVWESLASECYNRGQHINVMRWLHTDRKTSTIYINLNSDKNTILKVSGGKIEEILNGTNDEEVLLNSSSRIMPFNYMPDVKVSEGMKLLNELIFRNLTCDREQRYLILCWFMSCFLMDFSPYSALMKFSGSSSSGKTTAAKLLNLLLYGDPHLSDPTASAAYTVAASNPLLTIDNLESDDVTKGILKFLLLSVTKGSKEKRAGGTDTETVEETPKALVLITAIEPFAKTELINRTYDIEFSHRHKSDDFFEDDVNTSILKERDKMLSAILKIISSLVLPNLDRRREYNIVLKKEYRGHSKERTNEYLAMLSLLLEGVLKYIPFYDEDETELLDLRDNGAAETRRKWIEYQNEKAKETEVGTNPILTMLNSLWREYSLLLKDKHDFESIGDGELGYRLTHHDYGLEMTVEANKDYVEFLASSGDLFTLFSKLCKALGMRQPYRNQRQLGVRLVNDEHSLKDDHWSLIKKPGQNHYVCIHGERKYKFRKALKVENAIS